MTASLNPGPKALDGVKVLDLSRVLAGPWCTQILGDFGAEVIKIESPERGDDTRQWGPPYLTSPLDDDRGESAYYLSCNRNKRSVAIDLAKPEGAELIRRLAAHADIVVENFKLGGLKRYGLDYASLSAVNPRLVYCSITGFGQDGPYADRAGYDFVAQAMGGLMSITGEADGPPLKVGVAITDLSAGMYAAVSCLLALRHAERTGVGQHLDVSLLDTQMAMLANQALTWLVGGYSPGRMGNAHPSIVPYRVFDAKDGPLVIAVGNDGQFRALCAVLGAPEVAADERYGLNASRVVNRDSLEPTLQALVSHFTVAELMDMLTARSIPAGPVNTVGEIFEDPFAEARGAIGRFEREDGAAVPTVAFPGKLSATPADHRRRPPFLAEHTCEVLGEWLGLDAAALDALTAADVIRQRTASAASQA
jgi:crotonobetainyl-CoA:carnitine CoA-transferase CaiB-like acyl-CoA transferase